MGFIPAWTTECLPDDLRHRTIKLWRLRNTALAEGRYYRSNHFPPGTAGDLFERAADYENEIRRRIASVPAAEGYRA